jgi:uncharacterized membrane protein YidH (DUF202 family)
MIDLLCPHDDVRPCSRAAEPEPRFSMANERTFLAWIRTGLALLVDGVALETLASTMLPASAWPPPNCSS